VSTGGNEVLDGTTPPRIAIVDGGTNTVVCSWRGESGIGASGVHEGDRREGGADDAAATSRPAANKVGLNMEKCIVIVKILRWYARKLSHFMVARKQQTHSIYMGVYCCITFTPSGRPT
jgi:hypothetical protein